ncbi:YrrS family protein [Lysinibacillus piscis]|uniref:DUF1510 domain-containing protein n=1 Tax=Lysinibacillus piscis TaxID=2518931 RepID=A0ABQ5NJN8_9BACI|nr:YrrS family protein [Lysinibacillus sp. KH24]GLC88517.1 hypothetical protein LYSBPC_16440 [Lysinibacillus sp. KH24]
MSERQTRSSRHLQPSQNKKLDKLLNKLIAIVIVLIVITVTIVFKWQDGVAEKEQVDEPKNDAVTQKDNPVREEKPSEEKEDTTEPVDTEQESSVTEEPIVEEVSETTSDDPIVDKVITNKDWQPTPTTQVGQHVSSYDDTSVDWAEKIATITAVTELEPSDMIIWRMKNNGSASTAIATISSTDKSKMYRVSMEWVDNKGWLPLKVEQLNTLKGAY